VSTSPSRRILLVEDEVSVASAIADLLTVCGFHVDVIHAGGHAPLAIERFNPDVVVLDVHLPDMDGREVFRLLRERWPRLPVVFSSGHVRELDEVANAAGERVKLLRKPYEADALLTAIDDVCR
jgi:two-component system, OmpR family, response regulator